MCAPDCGHQVEVTIAVHHICSVQDSPVRDKRVGNGHRDPPPRKLKALLSRCLPMLPLRRKVGEGGPELINIAPVLLGARPT